MDTGKKRAPWVPASIEPPDPLASLEEWQSYRAGLDALEVRLLVSHPDQDWLEGMRAFKAEADAGIARHRSAWCKPDGERKILRAADAFRARRREGPYRFTQNRSPISVGR